ncbi:PAQR family membrane homeostasis protein TrhA [Oscillibacter ruminantium]|jgi:hemolysin III|uniref:PAQR family membrane homeostasis protein TrhA n=1 Tax=Oscillibacter ruminantium TaxID=1263547 RepID=UPI0003025391|nr:hemolysin III family protein [Oscillibacter ruminantium]MDN0033827.1 hemolysin III family protein [Oscillibacter valericigenes]MEA5042643.1 hemolysin III family protein [Oscillibacter ruminantium]
MRDLVAKAQDRVSFETHALGAVGALVGCIVMAVRGVGLNVPAATLWAALVFCLSALALYTASAVYHYYPGNEFTAGAKRFLRKMDHSMIYVLIAGSYTPFAMVMLPQPTGVRFCITLWAVALAGILMKLIWINAPRVLSTVVYLAMGWAVLFVAKDFAAVGQPCMTLVALGGVSYSLGAVFYAIKKPNISAEWTFHELFHLLILAGSLFHYAAVYFYVL